MKTATYTASLDELETDLLVATLFETERPPRGVTGLVDWRLNGFISRMILNGTVSGTYEESVLVPLHRRLPARRLLMLGLGRPDEYTLPRARHTAFKLGRTIANLKAIDVAVTFPVASDERVAQETQNSIFDAMGQAQLPSGLLLRWLAPTVVRFYEPNFSTTSAHAR